MEAVRPRLERRRFIEPRSNVTTGSRVGRRREVEGRGCLDDQSCATLLIYSRDVTAGGSGATCHLFVRLKSLHVVIELQSFHIYIHRVIRN